MILALGAILVYVGNEGRYKKVLISGLVLLIIVPFIFAFGFPSVKTQETETQSAMEQNILKKYNSLYGDGYFQKVEYAYSDKTRAKRWKHSNYFIITYKDFEQETYRFEFNRKGEPSCSCKLKH